MKSGIAHIPTRQIDDPCSPPSPAQPSEDGFTLVEIIVVLVIITILMAVAIATFSSSKKSGFHRSAVLAAGSYQDAIEAYMSDNGQTPPTLGGPNWPTPVNGPIDPMVTPPRPYLKAGAPESVADGVVGFGPEGGSAGTPRAYIGYRTGGAGQYFLHVVSVPADPAHDCWITNAPAPPAGGLKC